MVCSENIKKKEISNLRRSFPQIVAVMVKNILLLVYGMSLGMPTILIPRLSKRNDTSESIFITEEEISWIGSLNYLFVPLGCLLSGILTHLIGRKRSMQVISVLLFSAFLLFYYAYKPWHIFFALCFTGFTGGLLEAPTMIYVVEITEPDLRGALSSTSTVAILIGIIMSYVLGTIYPWRTMALINACVPVIGLLLFIIIPETPYWLLERKRIKEAKESIAWLRGWVNVGEIDEEYKSICDELSKKTTETFYSKIKIFSKLTFIKPYALMCLTLVLAHFGTTPINVYAIKIFEVLQVPIDTYVATILIGVIELFGSILLIFLVRYLGKRILTFVSLFGVTICFLCAGFYAYKINAAYIETHNFLNEDISKQYNWIPLTAILSMGFFSYIMIYSLPWIIMGEIFPNEVRDTAAGISASTGYVIGFLANKTFLDIVNLAGLYGVFWFYSGIAALGCFMIYIWLPETEGKSLQEITNHFSGGSQLSNQVKRYKRKDGMGAINNRFEKSESDEFSTRM